MSAASPDWLGAIDAETLHGARALGLELGPDLDVAQLTCSVLRGPNTADMRTGLMRPGEPIGVLRTITLRCGCRAALRTLDSGKRGKSVGVPEFAPCVAHRGIEPGPRGARRRA